MTYRTDHVEAYLQANQLRATIVFHDDFDRHETYVAAHDGNGNFCSLVTIGGEEEIVRRDHESGPEAIAYLMSVAFATFAHCTDDEQQITAELETARALKGMAVGAVLYNLKRTDYPVGDHLREMAITALQS